MKFRIVQLTSDSDIRVHGAPTCVTVHAQEEIVMGPNEVGHLEGKRTHHQQGAFMQGGMLNPGWRGKPSIEILLMFGHLEIKRGDEIAHALILEGENTEGYTFQDQSTHG